MIGSFYMKYVAELQEPEQDPNDVEKKLKEKIKGVIQCDITLDQFITKGDEGPYLIVFSSLCIENACENDEEYKIALAKLASLVEKNGYFLLMSTIREKAKVGYYIVNNVRLYNLAVKRNTILKSAEACGLQLLREDNFYEAPSESHNLDYFSFFIFQKQ